MKKDFIDISGQDFFDCDGFKEMLVHLRTDILYLGASAKGNPMEACDLCGHLSMLDYLIEEVDIVDKRQTT